ncbi:uncharacterized protein LOC131435712 [Malaya genurostris]|uniref:uncharacterized protein LOC131435712 n=1 Tax=Malaya genurostris TaxID=325434 RepID=UPI0026F3D1A8|nr:uncharacterized protein LOC131435712 [Malaya genurostris]
MSSTENNSSAATQGTEAPQAAEPASATPVATSEGEQTKQQEVPSSAVSNPAVTTNGNTEESSAGEAPTAVETKPAAAASEATSNGTVEKPKAGDGKASEKERPRFSSAARKRFRLLLGQGYTREEAAPLAQDPVKFKEARESAGKGKGTAKKFDFDEERKTLNGAGKKRLAWLLKNGYNEREAIALARKPVNNLKRGRSDDTNGNSALFDPPSKMAKPTTGSIRMAVTTTNHPASVLTRDQSNKIKAGILKQVIQQKDSPLKPHFEDCAFIDGYLRVLCSDQQTVSFLQQNVPKLELWKDASLKVVSEKNIKSDIFVGYFTDSRQDSNKDILNFVECQNDGISTSAWKVLSRKEIAGKQTTELKLITDLASAKIIHKLGYELNYKFNKIQIRRVKTTPTATQAPTNPRRAIVNRNAPSRDNSNQPRSSSFVPIWDNNLPKRSVFNRVPSPPRRSSFDNFNSNQFNGSSRGGGNWGSGGNNSLGSMNSFNSSGSSGQLNNRSSYSLVENLFDQLNRSTGNTSNSFDRYGSRRSNNSVNSRGSNSFNSRGSNSMNSRSNSLGNRTFFTTSRLGFF